MISFYDYPCECGHDKEEHYGNTGRCMAGFVAFCSCQTYRPQKPWQDVCKDALQSLQEETRLDLEAEKQAEKEFAIQWDQIDNVSPEKEQQ